MARELIILTHTKQLPVTFNQLLGLLFIICTDFCHVPKLLSSEGDSGYLRVYFEHLQITETGNLHGYTAVARELWTSTLKKSTIRRRYDARTYIDIGNLEPFTNYSVRVFPMSLLAGSRLGSKSKVFRTKERGTKCREPL